MSVRCLVLIISVLCGVLWGIECSRNFSDASFSSNSLYHSHLEENRTFSTPIIVRTNIEQFSPKPFIYSQCFVDQTSDDSGSWQNLGHISENESISLFTSSFLLAFLSWIIFHYISCQFIIDLLICNNNDLYYSEVMSNNDPQESSSEKSVFSLSEEIQCGVREDLTNMMEVNADLNFIEEIDFRFALAPLFHLPSAII